MEASGILHREEDDLSVALGKMVPDNIPIEPHTGAHEDALHTRSEILGSAMAKMAAAASPLAALVTSKVDAKPGTGCGDKSAPATSEGGLLARSRALGAAFEKKARAGVLPAAVLSSGADSEPGNGDFQRSRLGEWMELAARGAPMTRAGRVTKAVSGGLQNAHCQALRCYLVRALVASQGRDPSQQPTEVGGTDGTMRMVTPRRAEEAQPDDGADEGTRPIVLSVIQSHPGPEGLLVVVSVLKVQHLERCLAVGAKARLLLHRRHPALQQKGETWVPRCGEQLYVCGFSIAAAGAAERGPLLLPLSVSVHS